MRRGGPLAQRSDNYTGLKAVEQQPDHVSDAAAAAWKGQH